MEGDIIENLLRRYNSLAPLKKQIKDAAVLIIESFENGGKVLVCGNGGSSSDSGHIVGELMKGFELKRPLTGDLKQKLKDISAERGKVLAEKLQQGLPAISLSAHSDLMTAIVNDIDGDLIFAQQIAGYGKKGDVLLALSSSGNSQDVIDALITAKAIGLNTIGMTGEGGGEMKKYCDILINVPDVRTAYVQELHLPVYHTVCLIVENHFFNQGKQAIKVS
jgi:D-sedoheptulose 7-phosphate isomerase